MRNDRIFDALNTISPSDKQRKRMRLSLEKKLPKQEKRAGLYQARYAPARKNSWIPAAVAMLLFALIGAGVLSVMAGREEVSRHADSVPTGTPQETDVAAVYEPIVQKYLDAITEDWNGEQCIEADISIMVREIESTDDLGYALIDLDQDGLEELLITDGNVIYDLYTVSEESAVHILSGWERNSYFLTTGNCIGNMASASAAVSYYRYYDLRSAQLVCVKSFTFDSERDADSPWFRIDTETEEMIPITESEFEDEIWDYTQTYIEHRNILDYPGKAEKVTTEPDAAAYAAAIRRTGLANQDTALLNYVFCDYEPDGEVELLLGENGSILRVFKLRNGEVYTSNLSDGQDGTVSLCEGSVIKFQRGQNGVLLYIFSEIKSFDRLDMIEMLIFDENEGTWTHKTEDEGKPGRTIDEQTAQSILSSYEEVRLEWKDISDFPVTIANAPDRVIVYPIEQPMDGDLFENGIFSISMDSESVYFNGEGIQTMELTIHEYERFRESAVDELPPGAVIVLDGYEVTVQSVLRDESGVVHINGGCEHNGYTLTPNNDGTYSQIDAQGNRTFYVLGKVSCAIGESFAYIASTNPWGNTTLDIDAFVRTLEEDSLFLSPDRTTAEIRDGTVVAIWRSDS